MTFENGHENGQDATCGRHYPPSRDEYMDPRVPYLKLAIKWIVPVIFTGTILGYMIQRMWM